MPDRQLKDIPANKRRSHPMKTLYKWLNFAVSFFVLGLILILVYFMMGRLFGTAVEIFHGKYWATGSEVILLNRIAYAIVLIKAYTILRSYLKTHHLNLKFLVEIAIIAPVIELVFNAESHDDFLNAIFAIFGIANMVIYFTYYKQLDDINETYQQNKGKSFFSSFEKK